MQRDMTERQFRDSLKRHGFTFPPYSFMGYIECPCGVQVSRLNAGTRSRDQLRYLLAEEKKWRERKGEPTDAQ